MAERLTDRGIAALKPSDTSILIFDSEVSGLAARVYPSGRKVFVFDWRENHRQRRITLGLIRRGQSARRAPTPAACGSRPTRAKPSRPRAVSGLLT